MKRIPSLQPARRALLPAAALTLALGPCAARAAQTTLFDLSGSAVMVSACAGLQNGNGFSPGGLVGMLPTRSSCESTTTTLPGVTVGRSVSYDELPTTAIAASSQGQAQFGQLKLATSFEADTANGLTLGVVNAGWNETLTVLPSDPALLGQLALYSFGIHIDGLLSGAGFGNSAAGVTLWALVNDGFTGSFWVAQGMGTLNQPYEDPLDEDLVFSIPITLGTPFKLGFYGATWSGNSSGFGGASKASTELMNTITWDGVKSVSVNGNGVGYTLASTSGIDWTQPFAANDPDPNGVPAPSTALLLLAAGVALALRRGRVPCG